jgi:hypothetical protein
MIDDICNLILLANKTEITDDDLRLCFDQPPTNINSLTLEILQQLQLIRAQNNTIKSQTETNSAVSKAIQIECQSLRQQNLELKRDLDAAFNLISNLEKTVIKISSKSSIFYLKKYIKIQFFQPF